MLDGVLLGLRVALSLALVLAILWVVARQVGGRTSATRRVPVTVVGRQSLGRRAGVAVLEVGGRTLVVGVSDAGVRLITELDGDDEAAEAPGAPLRLEAPAGAAALSPYDPVDGEDAEVLRPAFARVGSARRSFEQVLRTETALPPARHRARRRAAAPVDAAGPLAGSVLDKGTWTRAWAVLQERSAR